MTEQPCMKCGTPVEVKKREGGAQWHRCKKCRLEDSQLSREKARQYNLARSKEKTRQYSLMSNHGITPAEFEVMFRSQNGRCAICHAAPKINEVFEVDHDHKTGAIRGVICKQCNLMLGHARDDPQILQSAIEYLTKVQLKVFAIQ